jgi:hypothetical protein
MLTFTRRQRPHVAYVVNGTAQQEANQAASAHLPGNACQ